MWPYRMCHQFADTLHAHNFASVLCNVINATSVIEQWVFKHLRNRPPGNLHVSEKIQVLQNKCVYKICANMAPPHIKRNDYKWFRNRSPRAPTSSARSHSLYRAFGNQSPPISAYLFYIYCGNLWFAGYPGLGGRTTCKQHNANTNALPPLYIISNDNILSVRGFRLQGWLLLVNMACGTGVSIC